VAAAIAVLALVGCGSKDSGQLNSSGQAQTGPTEKDQATLDVGAQAVQTRKCVQCHGSNMAGQMTPLAYPEDPRVELYPPNLTNDNDTGIGTWTDDQLANAIRNGQDKDGLELCPEMQHFVEMNDYEAYSIVKYLRSIPAVKQNVPGSICPPLKTGN
jgi:mono/diheme cytochrome c family protein